MKLFLGYYTLNYYCINNFVSKENLLGGIHPFSGTSERLQSLEKLFHSGFIHLNRYDLPLVVLALPFFSKI
jgi:hypothetical protein